MATIKQKKAFKELVVNGGNISKAMLTAGYSSTIVHATEKLTRSNGWQELMQKYLPDEELAKVHSEGLKATKIFSSHTEPDKLVPDFGVRHKYLDLAYDVKAKKTPQEIDFRELSLKIDL